MNFGQFCVSIAQGIVGLLVPGRRADLNEAQAMEALHLMTDGLEAGITAGDLSLRTEFQTRLEPWKWRLSQLGVAPEDMEPDDRTLGKILEWLDLYVQVIQMANK